MTLDYVNYIPWSRTKWEYSFTIHKFVINLEIWRELYSWHYVQESLFTLVLFAGNIGHPNIIPYKYYS